METVTMGQLLRERVFTVAFGKRPEGDPKVTMELYDDYGTTTLQVASEDFIITFAGDEINYFLAEVLA